MEFVYLLKALLRRWWVLLIAIVIGVATTYYFTRNEVRLYRSVAQLSTGFTVTEEIKLSDEKFNVQQIDVKFQNAIENILSPKVLNLVAYRLMIHDMVSNPSFRAPDQVKLKEVGLKPLDRDAAIVVLRNKLDSLKSLSTSVPSEKHLIEYINLYRYDNLSLQRALLVNRYLRTDYINLVCVSENPELSAFIVNTLCAEFKRFYSLDKRDRSDLSVQSLDSIVSAKRSILEEKISAKNAFMSSAGVVDVNLEGSSKLGQVSSFEGRLIDEKATEQSLVYRIGELDRLIGEMRASGTQTAVAPSVQKNLDNSEYVELRNQYKKLSKEYVEKGSSDPELKRRMAEISQRMSRLNTESDGSSGLANDFGTVSIDELIQHRIDLEGQLRACRNKISAMQSKLSQLSGNLNTMATKGANIEQLDKEIEFAQTEYKEANEKLNMALSMNESLPGTFKQTIFGEPAISPMPSKRNILIALAGLSALILSSLVIVGIEFFDNSIKNATRFSRLTGLSLIGLVNQVKIHGKVLGDSALFDGKENRDNIFREMLRKIRYQLEASGKKVILITSTDANQGKTMIIQAISQSLSLSKKKVLIIDTNFCNNDLTQMLGANPTLEEFSMEHQSESIEEFDPYISRSLVEGVDVIGCRGGDYTPSEILPQNHLLNHLDELKRHYDFIFLEGAPLNTYTDSKELINYADAILVIFSAEKVFTAADRESLKFLKGNKSKLMGAILNKVTDANFNM